MSASAEPLLRLLSQSRARLITRTALVAALGASTAATSVWLVGRGLDLARHLAWVGSAVELPLGPAMTLASGLGAILALMTVRDWSALRSPQALALATDRNGNLGLAYATALEAHSEAPIARALVAEASAIADKIDARTVWPLATKPVRVLLASCVIAGGAALALQLSLPPAPQDRVQELVSTDALREQAQELADRLKREAILRSDPLLEAIARAIEERVAEAAPETSTDELEAELGALVEQAKASFGQTAPSWLSADRAPAKAQEGTNTSSVPGGSKAVPQQEGDDTFAVSLEDLESARRNRALHGIKPETSGSEAESASYGEVSEGAPAPMSAAMPPQKIEPKQLQLAAREAVGAAADSGKGPADQAGGGSSDLTGDGFAGGAEGMEDMSLPQSDQETGRRIRITLPPSPEEQAAAGSQTGEAGGAIGIAAHHSVERSALPAGRRPALARYFEKLGE